MIEGFDFESYSDGFPSICSFHSQYFPYICLYIVFETSGWNWCGVENITNINENIILRLGTLSANIAIIGGGGGGGVELLQAASAIESHPSNKSK